MTNAAARIGEVIESSTVGFVAHCDALHTPPPLGSLVVVREGAAETLALVFHAETASIDPTRRPAARAAGFASEEEFYRRHPELSELLRTLFSAGIVAQRRGGRLLPTLPERPPRVHAFVYAATPEETAPLAASNEILPNLLAIEAEASDDFVAASLRTLAAACPDPAAFLAESGRRIVYLLRGDTRHLQALLPKLRPDDGRN